MAKTREEIGEIFKKINAPGSPSRQMADAYRIGRDNVPDDQKRDIAEKFNRLHQTALQRTPPEVLERMDDED